MHRLLFRNSLRSNLQIGYEFQRNFSNSNIILKQAGFGKYFIILTPIAGVGGVYAYAKQDEEFKKALIRTFPAAENVFKIISSMETQLKETSKKVEDVGSLVSNFIKKDEPVVVEKKEKPASVSAGGSSSSTVVSKKAPQQSSHSQQSEPAAPVKISKQKDTIPKDVHELEKAVDIAAAAAIQEYDKAIKILKSYNQDVQKVLDQAIEKADLNAWNTLKNRTSARDSAVELAEDMARDALRKIEKAEMSLSKVASTLKTEDLEKIRNKIRSLNSHINKVKDELYKEKDNANLQEKYWKKIESARNYFIDEIEAIFPGLDLHKKRLQLSHDDLDLFILHAYSHVLAYQKELQRMQLDGEVRLKRAIEALRGDDLNEAVRTQLEIHLENERRRLAIENQRKIFQIKAESEKQLRNQLKRQAEAHVDHIKDALSQKESELKRRFSIELDEKLASEKTAYKLQLATMIGKLKGMDAALNEIDKELQDRADAEKCSQQAQSLWAACQALWASIRSGQQGLPWHKKIRPLETEISAVQKAAAEGDELVSVILQNLPQEAKTRGVYPEDALKERFLTVEKTARKVALVPEEGASVFVYFLSYLQSLLILRSVDTISQDEIEDKPMDFSKFDTFDILSRAKYFLDIGDFAQALKYMNLLQGAPRKIASDWLKEARLLLETQQAANTLMAHAAASALPYL